MTASLLACYLSTDDQKGKITMKARSNKNDAEPSPRCGLPSSDEELKKILTPEQYEVIRENGTERPFTNLYWANKEPGIYVDLISGDALFSSRDKFDSGSGWPSFTAPINELGLKKIVDRSHAMERTEVRARKSNSHLGHLFEDGPAPTGLRYCINSASLRFVPVEKLEEEGYGDLRSLFSEEVQEDAAALDSNSPVQVATFGAGCFWSVEAAFRKIEGVLETAVGYIGGTSENPSYQDVCSGCTGHAEGVQVKYDPNRVTYQQLLEVFWKIHDPSTRNRQGPDIGTQYRSVIFFHSDAQEAVARKSLQRIQESGRYKRDIVTEISRAPRFYRAEEYHQQYQEKQGGTSIK